MTRQGSTTVSPDGGPAVAAVPLLVDGNPAGALVIQTPVPPSAEDLELLALLSAQASVALHNAGELERLRGGAVVALGRVTAEVAHEVKNPLAGLLYARHLESRLVRRGKRRPPPRPQDQRWPRHPALWSATSRPWPPRGAAARPVVLSQLIDECLLGAGPPRGRDGRGGRTTP
jgi:signal transduction histidine kinase